jgi:hypothetical protein
MPSVVSNFGWAVFYIGMGCCLAYALVAGIVEMFRKK